MLAVVKAGTRWRMLQKRQVLSVKGMFSCEKYFIKCHFKGRMCDIPRGYQSMKNNFERHISTRQANYASLSKSMRGKGKKKNRQNHQYKLAACCHTSLWKRASLLLLLKFKTANKLCPDNKGQFENVQTWYNECPNKKNRKQPDCKTRQPFRWSCSTQYRKALCYFISTHQQRICDVTEVR